MHLHMCARSKGQCFYYGLRALLSDRTQHVHDKGFRNQSNIKLENGTIFFHKA